MNKNFFTIATVLIFFLLTIMVTAKALSDPALGFIPHPGNHNNLFRAKHFEGAFEQHEQATFNDFALVNTVKFQYLSNNQWACCSCDIDSYQEGSSYCAQCLSY